MCYITDFHFTPDLKSEFLLMLRILAFYLWGVKRNLSFRFPCKASYQLGLIRGQTVCDSLPSMGFHHLEDF